MRLCCVFGGRNELIESMRACQEAVGRERAPRLDPLVSHDARAAQALRPGQAALCFSSARLNTRFLMP
eukprot:297650-Rhodomonas_salina.4